MLSTACPGCGAACELERLMDWVDFGTVPVSCKGCDQVFWMVVTSEQHPAHVTAPVGMPTFIVGDVVKISQKCSPFHGMAGRIVDKLQAHYRVSLGGRTILVPHSGVEAQNG